MPKGQGCTLNNHISVKPLIYSTASMRVITRIWLVELRVYYLLLVCSEMVSDVPVWSNVAFYMYKV
jgi:hypothetical protein